MRSVSLRYNMGGLDRCNPLHASLPIRFWGLRVSLINPISLGIPSLPDFIDHDTLWDPQCSSTPNVSNEHFPTVYAFGDSLSDAGNDFVATGMHLPVSPPYYQGHFSNGLTWVEDLALSQGLGPLAPSLLPGGTDFAFGGAETGTTPLHDVGPTDLPSQLAQFEANYPTPQSGALYTLSIGATDLFDAIAAFPSTPFKALADVAVAVANVDHFVLQLASHGAKDFLILNAPDIGKAPAYSSQGPRVSSTASALSRLFDIGLNASLNAIAAKDHLNLNIVDTYSLIDTAVADPSMFGFTNVTDPVWTGNNTNPNSGVLQATTPAAQSQYLFWDQVHPTSAAHLVLANTAESTLLHTI
jgi:phospholipase/lecithinase/hemolysin